MTYICNSCGEVFTEPKYIKNGGGDVGEDWPVCPECYNDDTEEARRCIVCDTVKRGVDMCSSIDVCVTCMQNAVRIAKISLQHSLSDKDYKAFRDYYELDSKIH